MRGEVLGNDGIGMVASRDRWVSEAEARAAHKRRCTNGGATGEHERLHQIRPLAPLPRPGDRAHLDDEARERDARRHARYEIAESLQRYHRARYGPRKDAESKDRPRTDVCDRWPLDRRRSA